MKFYDELYKIRRISKHTRHSLKIQRSRVFNKDYKQTDRIILQ